MNIERPRPKQQIPSDAQRVFRGQIFDVYQWPQKMFDGTTRVFEQLRRADTVVVIPVTSNRKILLIEEEQPGKPVSIVTPGGRLDLNEDPLVGAQRELREETGYEAEQYDLWFSEQHSSAMDWAMYYFIARGCRRVSESQLDGGEKISLQLVSFKRFTQMALAGEINDSRLKSKIREARFDSQINKLRRWFYS